MKSIGAFVMSGNQAFFFRGSEAARGTQRFGGPVHRPDAAQDVRVPGILVFLQNPPPITVSGQFATSVYQIDRAERQSEGDLRLGGTLMAKMRALPNFWT